MLSFAAFALIYYVLAGLGVNLAYHRVLVAPFAPAAEVVRADAGHDRTARRDAHPMGWQSSIPSRARPTPRSIPIRPFTADSSTRTSAGTSDRRIRSCASLMRLAGRRGCSWTRGCVPAPIRSTTGWRKMYLRTPGTDSSAGPGHMRLPCTCTRRFLWGWRI